MGACGCKCLLDANADAYSRESERETPREPRGVTAAPTHSRHYTYDPKFVEEMVVKTLANILVSLETPGEYMPSILRVHMIAEKDEGWLQVVKALVNVVPLEVPFGPSMITILLEECPLPTKETVLWVTEFYKLSAERAERSDSSVTERNILVILGLLATKLAGRNSIAVLTNDTLEYLLTYLKSKTEARLVLFAIITLEKFAQTMENKITIKNRLEQEKVNPLAELERLDEDQDMLWRQVGFCAKWSLDNVFALKGRTFSFESVDMSEVNVMLNTNDVSEYLKISPNGLEARSDSYLFESVRCTYQVNSGCWYYEVLIVTPGVMQIGWATKNSHFLNHDGFGIGDDIFSVSYDGCRRLVWHEARSQRQELPRWRPGDILGCLIDVAAKEIIFSVNGRRLPASRKIFTTVREGFFAAASFMTFQQCRFNFGREPFRYPPYDREFSCFNKHGLLTEDDKKVIPRHMKMEKMRDVQIGEDSCTLCFDRVASCSLLPCGHSGFCFLCTSYLNECPLCRAHILNVHDENIHRTHRPSPSSPADPAAPVDPAGPATPSDCSDDH